MSDTRELGLWRSVCIVLISTSITGAGSYIYFSTRVATLAAAVDRAPTTNEIRKLILDTSPYIEDRKMVMDSLSRHQRTIEELTHIASELQSMMKMQQQLLDLMARKSK